MLAIDDALVATRWLAALMIAHQAIELLSIRAALSEDGVWRPTFAQRDVGRLVGVLFSPRAFIGLLILRLVLAGVLVSAELLVSTGPSAVLVASGLLVLTQLVVSARFGGSFNGGSDGMTLVVSMGLLVAALPHPSAPLIGLGYIAAQSLLSYWVAGLVKIRERDWRSGRALMAFSRARRYGIPPRYAAWLGQPRVALAASWAVMGFECAFPLGLLRPEAMALFTCIALLFHLGNWAVFGLNRFVFAWVATYPALLFVASEIARTHGGP